MLFRSMIRLLTASMTLCGLATSRPGLAADPVFVFDLVTSKTTVNPDNTWMIEADITIQAPRDNPARIVRVPLIWSKSVENLTVVDALLEKKGAAAIRAPAEAMREDPLTGDRYFHEFSDLGRKMITFTDVDAGDILHLRTRRDVVHPRVPGGFMIAPVLDPSVQWEETNDTIVVSESMPLRVEFHGFDHRSAPLAGGRVSHTFHSSKAAAVDQAGAAVGNFDRQPRYAVSSFADWDVFAKAYAEVFLPHAKATATVGALADKITAGEPDKRAQARALYHWVRDNIQYIPMPLEEGKRDPHDAGQVIANLFGDTKDHAVLLYALLTAKGIPAQFVLINAGDTGTIADVPNVRPMNHVILYLPGLGVYLDSTLGAAPFGALPFRQIGKPVIHLGGSGAARRAVPIPAADENWMEFRTEAALTQNGTVEGTSVTTAHGPFAVWLRGAAEAYGNGVQRDASAIALLQEHGTPGTGKFAFNPPTAQGDDFQISGTFKIQSGEAIFHGGYFTLWTGLRVLPRPGDFLTGPLGVRPGRTVDKTFCYPGIQKETLVLTLPEGRAVGTLPRDEIIDDTLLQFHSHWSLEGTRVSVTREFRSTVSGPVCEGRIRDKLTTLLARVRGDLSNQVGLKVDPFQPAGASQSLSLSAPGTAAPNK